MARNPDGKAETQSVKMDDGRITEFVGKQKVLKQSLFGEHSTQVRLDFKNGETRIFTIPEALYAKFAAHGAEQKLGDELAGVDDIEDCVMAIDALIDRLEQGDWSLRREKTGMAGTSVLAKALVEHTGKNITSIKEFLQKKSQAEKVALRSHPSIKPIVDRIEAEKAATTKKSGRAPVDTDSMLEELA